MLARLRVLLLPALAAASLFSAACGSSATSTTAPAPPPRCAISLNTSAWLSITAGSSGTGNGAVAFMVAANTGAARSGTLTIAGRTFTVEQAGGCTYGISPSQSNVPGSGGPVDVAVTTASGCAWAAASQAAWISVASGASGAGNGTVRLSVETNTGATRSGTVTIAGQTFTVDQGTGCTYAITPTSQAVPSNQGTVTVTVTAAAGCAWTSASNASWITITSGASGTGSGTVELRAGPNNGSARTGTATIAGQTFTIDQEGRCEFVVAPETVTAPAAGSVARVAVTTTGGCSWTAASSDQWITVTGSASGTGSGAIDLTIAANTGPARAGSALVAGRTVMVTQESGCAVTVTPTSQDVAAAGGTGSVAVQTTAGCGWTAVSSAAWLVVTAGASGTGDGVVQFTVDANATGAPRSATIAIGGRVFTVNQQ